MARRSGALLSSALFCGACQVSFGSAAAPAALPPVVHVAAPHVAPELLPAKDAPPSRQLLPVRPSSLCVTSGKLVTRGPQVARVDVGGMRGVVAGSTGQVAEVEFTYLGPSATTVPLASGELRRQIGLKLRAKDTCNVVYVMWHVSPTPGVAISVKHNPGASTHTACGAGGYENLKSTTPTKPAPELRVGERHSLHAEIDGRILRVTADGALAFEAPLPAEAFTFDGPAGVRSDNGAFDLELRVPALARGAHACP